MEKNLVVKSNELIEARYKLNINEQKILLYAISKLDRDKKEMNIIEFDTLEFTELIDSKGNRYEDFRETVRSLRKKEVIITTDDKEMIAGWLSNIKIYKNTGKVTLKFDDELIPYLLQLKSRFTRYELKNILYLKSKYSIRVYELLKQYQVIKSRKFTLEELKEILMLEKNQYNRIYDFERFVLKPSMEEINEYTDLEVSYEKLKKGRKVIGIKYIIQSKEDNSYITYLNENYNIKEFKEKSGLAGENFDSKQIIELYAIACEKLEDEFETIDDIFEYIRLNYLHMLKNKTVKNKYAYLKKSLDEDYAVARGQIKFDYKLD